MQRRVQHLIVGLLGVSVAVKTYQHQEPAWALWGSLSYAIANIWAACATSSHQSVGLRGLGLVNSYTAIALTLVWGAGAILTFSQPPYISPIVAHWSYGMHLLATLASVWGHKGYAQGVLPFWTRLAIAEAQAVAKVTALHRHKHLAYGATLPAWELALIALAFQLCGVVLPFYIYPCPRKTNKVKATPSARQESALVPASIQDECGYVSPQGLRDVGAEWPTTPCALQCKGGDSAVPYTSVLGERFLISIKVSTKHNPSDLPSGALTQLARLVEDAHMADGRGTRMVLSASVHKGCIVFGLELCAPRPATGDNETATTTHSNSNMDINELLEYARRVLPHLLTDLGLDGQCTGGDEGLDAIGEKLSVTATGHRLSIHVGPYSVYATYDKQSHDWLLEPGVVSMAGVPPGFMPELCLAQPRPALAPAAAPAAGVHAVQFSVQLMCAGAPFVPPQPHLVVTGVDPTDDSAFAECTGPLTASHNRHHNHAPSTVRAMQVWVSCQGQYVRTTVDQTTHTDRPGVLTVTAHVPIPALRRHHQPDGPVAQLQTATVELWLGTSMMISTTPLLFDVSAHAEPPVVDGFGWWGVEARNVPGLVQDIKSLIDKTIEEGYQVEDQQPFLSDLSVFLVSAQQYASERLCDMVPATEPLLSMEQCQALADGLHAHAVASGLPAAANVIGRLRAQLFAPRAPTAGSGNCVSRAVGRVCAGAAAALRPCQCAECNRLFYARLRRNVRELQATATVVLSVVTLVAFFTVCPTAPGPIVALLMAMSACRLASLATCYPPATAPRPGTWRAAMHTILYDGWLQIIGYALYAILLVSTAFESLVPFDKAQCTTSGLGPFFITNSSFLVLAQQVHLWGRVPDWVVRAMMVGEALAHNVGVHRCPSLSQWFMRVWYCLGSPAVSWGLYRSWRRTLRSRVERKSGLPVAVQMSAQGKKGDAVAGPNAAHSS